MLNAMARADLYAASELRQSLELHPDEILVDRAKVPLEQIIEAHELSESGKAVGKVVVVLA